MTEQMTIRILGKPNFPLYHLHHKPTRTNVKTDCLICKAGDKSESMYFMTVIGKHQFRFSRSKKKRIRKKWLKQPHNWRFDKMPSVMRISKNMKEVVDEYLLKAEANQ